MLVRFKTRGGKALVAEVEYVNTVNIFDADRIIDTPISEKRCQECAGSGQIRCDCCGQPTECPECEGSGWITTGGETIVAYDDPEPVRVKIVLPAAPASGPE